MQRQLAIQRLQEQEKERQMRLEQQKQTIQMRAQMPAFSLPYAQVRPARCHCVAGLGAALTAALTAVLFCPQLQTMPAAGGVLYQPSGPTSFPGTFSPAGSAEGSPMHTVYLSQPAPGGGGGPYPSVPGAGAGDGRVEAPTRQAEPQTVTPVSRFLFRRSVGFTGRLRGRVGSVPVPGGNV